MLAGVRKGFGVFGIGLEIGDSHGPTSWEGEMKFYGYLVSMSTNTITGKAPCIQIKPEYFQPPPTTAGTYINIACVIIAFFVGLLYGAKGLK